MTLGLGEGRRGEERRRRFGRRRKRSGFCGLACRGGDWKTRWTAEFLTLGAGVQHSASRRKATAVGAAALFVHMHPSFCSFLHASFSLPFFFGLDGWNGLGGLCDVCFFPCYRLS